MIDVHYWTTPNGHKVTIFLEEAGLEYKIIPVNIGKGEQFKGDFLAVSPNNRIPAIVDHDEPYVWMVVAKISAAASRNGSPARAFLLIYRGWRTTLV